MMVEDQQEIIDFLSTPSTYGADISHVERIDTHSASIFLAGDLAYKLKRAVRYDYLDFSTREVRRAMCDAEVALNRRTAPRLYLGVRAVTREANGRLSLEGHGPPVDWLVCMVRFDQAALLNALAAAGALDLDLMPRLATADRRPAPVRGATHRLRRPREPLVGDRGNAAGLAEHGAGLLDRADCDRLDTEARAALARHRERLEDRRGSGWVRACHGDLHLRNIVLIDGHPTLFDAVEFNDQISCIDVLYDVAFLLMDLWRLRLRAHANALFNEYLAATSQLEAVIAPAPLPLVPIRSAGKDQRHGDPSAIGPGRPTAPGGLRARLPRARAGAPAAGVPAAHRRWRVVRLGQIHAGETSGARTLAPRQEPSCCEAT